MKIHVVAGCCLLSCALLSVASAAQNATTVQDAPLKREPYSDAEDLARLAAQTPVEVSERKGAWVRVQSAAGEGWLRLLSVRFAGGASLGSGDSGLSQAINVARSGSSGTAVATGVRGLDQEQIRSAVPDRAELARLDGYAASEASARAFAQAGPLSAQQAPYVTASGDVAKR